METLWEITRLFGPWGNHDQDTKKDVSLSWIVRFPFRVPVCILVAGDFQTDRILFSNNFYISAAFMTAEIITQYAYKQNYFINFPPSLLLLCFTYLYTNLFWVEAKLQAFFFFLVP